MSERNPFEKMMQIAIYWENNPMYWKVIEFGKKITNGEPPNKNDDISVHVTSLYMHSLEHALPASDAFYIATAYAYCTDGMLISMTQLAKGLARARATNTPDLGLPRVRATNTPHLGVVPNMDNPTNAERVYATQWVVRNNIRVYRDPNEPNQTRANRVLLEDVMWVLMKKWGEQGYKIL